MKKKILSLTLIGLTSLSFAQKKIDFITAPSLIYAAKERGDVKLADSIAYNYIENYLFKLKKGDLMTEHNLSLIGEFLNEERSKAFKLFKNEPEKVNAILGDYMAQKCIMGFINKKYLPKGDYANIEEPDWDTLEKVVVEKFGSLGEEIVCGQRMIYSLAKKDWKSYGIWYEKYFIRSMTHSLYDVNNLSWLLFENVQDQQILSFACKVMGYTLEKKIYKDNFLMYDTYANLLYKTGKKDLAIEWEEKALRLSNNDKTILEFLEKMRKNEKTWAEVSN